MIEIVLKIPTMMLRIMDFLKITIVLQLIDVEQNDDVDDIILSMSLNIFENTSLWFKYQINVKCTKWGWFFNWRYILLKICLNIGWDVWDIRP